MRVDFRSQSRLLSDLEELGRNCRGIDKKVPETSPPGTQQHLVTCSRRGRHNTAIATRCNCVLIDTKFTFPFVVLREAVQQTALRPSMGE